MLLKVGVGDDEFYLFISSFEHTALHQGTGLHYNYDLKKKKSLLERGFVSPEGNIPCNAGITNSLLHQNECLPKCYISESTHSKHQMYVLWECKEKDDVSSKENREVAESWNSKG